MIVQLPDGRPVTLPLIQCGVMGTPNSGKTHLAASFEKPMLVIATDPYSKMQAYYDRGVLDEKKYQGALGQPIEVVRSLKNPDSAIIQLEYFFDEEPLNPQAMQAVFTRLPQIRNEVKAGQWRTIVVDSWTQLEYIAYQRRTTGAFKAESVAGAAKDDLKQILNSYLITMPCNLVIVLHIESKMIDQGGGMVVYTPRATGQLKVDIGSVLGEMYRAVFQPNATLPGGGKYQLQTIPDGRFDCGTRIGAPNGCDNQYPALFTNWLAKRAAIASPAVPTTTAEAASVAAPQMTKEGV